MKCTSCGRDINAIGQDNVSHNEYPLCEDCARDYSVVDFPTRPERRMGGNKMCNVYIIKTDKRAITTTKPNFEIKNDREGKPYFVYGEGSTNPLRVYLEEFDFNEFWEEYKYTLKHVSDTCEYTDASPSIVIEIENQKISVYSL